MLRFPRIGAGRGTGNNSQVEAWPPRRPFGGDETAGREILGTQNTRQALSS